MRTLKVSEITEAVKGMCIEANHFLTEDMKCALEKAALTEESILGRQILEQLQENLRIAGDDRIPICQDTGMAVIFVEVGQEIHFEGGTLTEAIQEGVRRGYQEGFLRKSVVKDPLIREVLGEEACRKYAEAKRQEWEAYNAHISGWELDNYLLRI